MNKNYYAVLMAGGVGSRFWPVSTAEFPKQFHDMLGVGQSLIQRTFKRINGLVPSNNILIATNARYKNLVLEQLPKATRNSLLLEPSMRNTAPCILYSALKIYEQNPDAVILVAPSDHWIDDETEFLFGGGVLGSLSFGEWYAGIDFIDGALLQGGIRYNF